MLGFTAGLVAALLPAPPAMAWGVSNVEMVCPCRVTAVDQTAIGVEFGVRSINTEAPSGQLKLVVLSTDAPDAVVRYHVAKISLDPIPAEGEHPHAVRVTGLVVIESGGPSYLGMELFEDDRVVDSARLDGGVLLSGEGGSSAFSDHYGSGGIHFRGDAAVTLTDEHISVTVPRIVNTSVDIAENLTLRVRATRETTAFSPGYTVFVQDLDEKIEPGAAKDGLVVEGVPLVIPPEGFEYLHVVLTNTPEGSENDPVWQLPLVWQTLPPTEDAPWNPRRFMLENLDTLTDSDGDGVSDFNERRFAFADPDDPAVKPPESTVRLLMLVTPMAEREFGDTIDTKIDHVLAYTNRVFAESGVGVRFELAGVEPVDVEDLTMRVLAFAANHRLPPFEGISDLLTSHKADMPAIVHRRSAEDDTDGAGGLSGLGHRGDLAGLRGAVAFTLAREARSFAHEIGHAMGLHHSRRQREFGSFKWSVGHGEDNSFVTIMAYWTAFENVREIDLFSSPDLMCASSQCGVDRTDRYAGADAVMSLETTRFQVAAFAGSKPPDIVLKNGDHVFTVHRMPFVDPGFRVEDDGDFDLEFEVQITGTVDTGRLGDYTLNYSVGDTEGNLTSVARVVTVDVDTDSDGVVDALDDDDDGDGMPDAFETTYGLNPLVDDAQGDLDNDGYSNLREYKARTDPTDPESSPANLKVASVALFPALSAEKWEGFVRVINRSDDDGIVTIEAIDDTGVLAPEVTFPLGALQTAHFNSGDLENGNPKKGLSGQAGAGTGDWRLVLSSELDFEALSYVRTPDGFLTAMHDVAPSAESENRVATFNPGRNVRQQSFLRLVNPGEMDATATVEAVDDRGSPSSGTVLVSIPAGEARTFSAAQLEAGDTGLDGALGDGVGKWQLSVEADGPLIVMSLLQSPSGHLTNLSTGPDRGAGPDSGSTVGTRP